MILITEHAGDLDGQQIIGLAKRSRSLACLLEELLIASRAREPQIREPGLPRSEQLALTSKLEIDFCQLEAVGRRNHGLEPLGRSLGQLFLGSRHEQTVGLVLAAADPSA